MEEMIFTSISKDSIRDLILQVFKDQVTPHVIAVINNRDETEILTKKEAARLLKVSEKTIEDWTKQALFPSHRIGRRIRYKKTELLSALKHIRHNNSIK